jgi:hypothetical protein
MEKVDMNKIVTGILGTALLAIGLAIGVTWFALRSADPGGAHPSWLPQARDLAPVTDERYRTECGGCHFAFQPGLLPAAAWGRLLGALADHFGDDATLDPEVVAGLLDYLTANAADVSPYLRSRAFAARPIATDRPPRITETVYFARKHHAVPPRLVKDNPKVGSFSNCLACHRGAEQGSFNEHQLAIPGGAGIESVYLAE